MTKTETTTESIQPYFYDDLRPEGANGNQCPTHLSAKKYDSLKPYFYDGDGLRISRTDNLTGLITYYVWDSENPTGYPQVVEEIENNQVVRRYGYGLFLETIDIKNGAEFERFYVIRDGTNSVRMLLDSTGNVSATYDYDAFGNVLSATNSNPLTVANPYQFHSEYRDSATGLVYLRARWYDSRDGRFLRADSYEGENENPASLHKYVFTNNDAVNYTDPTGLFYSSVTSFLTSEYLSILSPFPNVTIEGGARKPISSLITSIDGRNFIKSWEKFKPYARDDGFGNPTVGWGHKLKVDDINKCWSKNDPMPYVVGENVFVNDVYEGEQKIKDSIFAPLYQKEFDALSSLAFNYGIISTWNLVKLINGRRYYEAANEFSDISNIKNKRTGVLEPIGGLSERRANEKSMYQHGIYIMHR